MVDWCNSASLISSSSDSESEESDSVASTSDPSDSTSIFVFYVHYRLYQQQVATSINKYIKQYAQYTESHDIWLIYKQTISENTIFKMFTYIFAAYYIIIYRANDICNKTHEKRT